jgi:uncharacterized protein (TIGR02996 family)
VSDTVATSDAGALLATIYDQPEEDTPRRMYADAIEDVDPARAELIRVQCEAAAQYPTITKPCRNEECASPGCALLLRAESLIAAHEARWRAGPKCERCEGKGDWFDGYAWWKDCPECWVSGDIGGLMRVFNYTHDHGDGTAHGEDELVRIEYVRGFARVNARSEDVWKLVPGTTCHNCKGLGQVSERRTTSDCVHCNGRGHSPDSWHPTPWIAAVLRHHPVTEVWVTDREPIAVDGGFWWWPTPGKVNRLETHGYSIPDPVFDRMAGGSKGYRIGHDTEHAWIYPDPAKVALARVVARWARAVSPAR